MNKRTILTRLLFALVSFSIISCTQTIEGDGIDGREQVRLGAEATELAFTAEFERAANPSTKVVLGDNLETLWEQGDQINIFYGATQGPGAVFTAEEISMEGQKAVFSGTISAFTGTVEGSGNAINFCGLYPYSQANTYDGTYAHMNLPHIQHARKDTEDPMSKLLIAKSPGLNLYFYLVGSGLRFEISRNDIAEFRFSGNDGEILAGDLTIGFDNNGRPEVTAVANPQYEISVFPAANDPTYLPEAFTPGYYYLDIIPQELEHGYTVTYITTSGQQGSYTLTSSRSFARTVYNKFSSKESQITFTDIPPQANQIRYTATAKVDYNIPTEGIIRYGNVVESNVFNQTTHVGTITFANAITGLDHDAFFGNEDLISVTLPDGLEDIEFRAFAYCPNLVSVDIPSSVQGIGWAAFKGCTSLEHIYVPELIGLGGAVFANCLSLRSFSGPYASADGKFLIYHLSWNGEDFLSGCALKSFEGQDLIIPEGIDVLIEGVFAGGQFASVSIPETVKEIEESCFESCVISSSTLTIPGSVTTIGDNAFYGCSSLNTIILDRGSYAGLGSEGFEWPGLPTLGDGAFNTSTATPCTIKVPGAYVIANNAGVYVEGDPWYAYRNQVVVYQADNELWYSHENEAAGIPVAQAQLFTAVETSAGTEYQWVQTGGFFQREHYPYDGLATEPVVPYPTNYSTMPIIVEVYANDVIAVSAPASHLSQKQYVSLPHSLEVIGKEAFKNASSLLVFPANGANLTSIGESAFYGCSSMAFPDNGNALNLSHVSSLGAYAFYDCQQFGSGSVNAGSILFLGPVTTIPERAFYQCKMLTHIYVSQNNIATVGTRAFYGCNALKALAGQALLSEDDSVHLPATTSLGIEAFAYCSSITDVTLGSVVTIPKGAFGLCSNLKTVSLNTGTLTTIGPNAFAECRLLRQIGDDTYSVNLPYVKTIDNEAFSNCQSISEIRLPNIHVVGNRAFAFTRGLESISFGRFLNTLGELIFYDNSTSNSVRNYDKLTLYFNGSYPALVSALNSTSPTFGYTSQTNYFWPKNIRVENQSLDVLEVYNTRLPDDWNEAIRDKIQLYHIP